MCPVIATLVGRGDAGEDQELEDSLSYIAN